jgi:cation diffusion facilitator CzcD-associated flavoprotein CzcO
MHHWRWSVRIDCSQVGKKLSSHKYIIIAELCRYLVAEKAFSHIVIFEQRDNVGGLWNYLPRADASIRNTAIPQTTPNYDDNEEHVISPIYDLLETNIPRGLMGFSDLPWDEDCQLFPGHQTVLDYLEQYANGLHNMIRFATRVVNVSPTEDQRWLVETNPAKGDDRSKRASQVFDAVLVASGHFDVPYVPSVPGIEAWNQAHPGRISHSKFYRRPEDFRGKKVVVVGNSASGVSPCSMIDSLVFTDIG